MSNIWSSSTSNVHFGTREQLLKIGNEAFLNSVISRSLAILSVADMEIQKCNQTEVFLCTQ